jgi:hypothetical protein
VRERERESRNLMADLPFQMPPSKYDKINKKLKVTQRTQVSRPTPSVSKQKSTPSPMPSKRIKFSPVIRTRRVHQPINSTTLEHASIKKHSHRGYLTLLDINMMNKVPLPASRILPTEELVPNSYHQTFHVARWRTWLKETPQVLISVCLVE